MAILSSSNHQNMSSNFVKRNAARANIQASAYAVDVATGELQGMHFSTSGAGVKGSGGGFEVSTGIPSPPPSPRRNNAAAAAAPAVLSPTRRSSSDSVSSTSSHSSSSSSSSSGRYGAAHTISEECERLFCGTLRSVFLGEGKAGEQDSLEMGALPTIAADNGLAIGVKNNNNNHNERKDSGSARLVGVPMALPTPPSSLGSVVESNSGAIEKLGRSHGLVKRFVEVWTYHSGLRFRGFVAEKDGERSLFVFFEKDAVGKDLKKPLMALLELATAPEFECEKLVACLDRRTDRGEDHDRLVHDLGWVGFEPTTLEPWAPDLVDITSPRWLLLSMDV